MYFSIFFVGKTATKGFTQVCINFEFSNKTRPGLDRIHDNSRSVLVFHLIFSNLLKTSPANFTKQVKSLLKLEKV